MALPDYIKFTEGTAKSWKASGGDYAITLTSVANGNGRQGAKGDLGAFWARTWVVMLVADLAAAGTNDTELELYSGESPSATAGTDNPGGLSGTDATFNTTPTEYKKQLTPIGGLAVSANAGTALQKQLFEFVPKCRYQSPVVVNRSGQALGATAGNFEIRFIPKEEVLADTVTG